MVAHSLLTHEKGTHLEPGRPRPTPPKLVIFDSDGVLVDSVPLIRRAMVSVLASYGLQLSLDEVVKHLSGLQNDDIRNVVASRWGVSLPEQFLEAVEAAERAEVEKGLLPVEGAEVAVRLVVEAGVATCVASNGSPEEIEHRLKLTGLFHWFEGRLFSGWTVPRPKPHPDVFLHAAASMGYPSSECVVVEDSPAGIQAGVAAGMRVLAYTGGSDDAAAVLAGVETFNSMSSLPALLGF